MTTTTGPVAATNAAVADAQGALAKLKADYATAVAAYKTGTASIAVSLKNHVSLHQTIVAEHAAEVAAGNTLLDQIAGGVATVDELPKIILSTQSGTVAKIKTWLKGASWRPWAAGLAALYVLHSCVVHPAAGLVKHILP